MNGNALGDDPGFDRRRGDKTDRTALFRAIGNAIVTHITTNARWR